MYVFANDLPEDGPWGSKHVGGASQNNKQLFTVIYAVGWTEYLTVTILHVPQMKEI
jgi:hypothetical protein